MIRLAVLLTLLSGQAAAQSNCAPRDGVVEKLQSSYGEQIAGGGLVDEDQVFEIWFSRESSTWTILLTGADGTTCVMAHGSNWREFLVKELPEGEKG